MSVARDPSTASGRLVAEFPELFDCAYDVSLPSGWYTLARLVCASLRIVEPGLKIAQLKQKCGGARLYPTVRACPDAQRFIDEFEAQTFRVCEVCGAPGETHGWHTLCETHL